MDSNFCAMFKGDRVMLLQDFSRERVKLFAILFLGVYFLFSFEDPEKDGRVLGI